MTKVMEITVSVTTAGLVWRPFDVAHDYPALVELMNVCNEADGIESIETLDGITNSINHMTGFNPATDMLVVQAVDQIIGYGRTWNWVNDVGECIYGIHGNVHPAWRGKGLGRAILSWQEQRAREIATPHSTSEPRFLQAFVHNIDKQYATLHLLEHAGYTTIRYGFMMVRENLDDIPDLPLPHGLEVRPVRPEHLRCIWDALNEAFRDHWGHRESTEADYERFVNEYDQQLHLWQVAWDTETNEVAGMVLNEITAYENECFHEKRGWTDPICVRRAWRRRGLARALIMRSLRVLREQGMTEAALGVDAQNPNKAMHLYERCGYRPVIKSYTMRKEQRIGE